MCKSVGFYCVFDKKGIEKSKVFVYNVFIVFLLKTQVKEGGDTPFPKGEQQYYVHC